MQRLKVVVCWHMHQPWYMDGTSGCYRLPWTYLHAIKDYVDMAAHLEGAEAMKAVVNFTPTLLEQIEDYDRQIARALADGTPLRDPLLNALASASLPAAPDRRIELMQNCLRAQEERLIRRYDEFDALARIARAAISAPRLADYLNDQFLADLLVWYHLAWVGETLRLHDQRIRSLIDKGRLYSHTDRLLLLRAMGEALSAIVPRYRALAESGRIELSVTPYAHPILPLLIDFESAREAMPDAPLPRQRYPGGLERAHWHVSEAKAVFERAFGMSPAGCWPAEGAVSDAALAVLREHGFRWAASGEGVLGNSLERYRRGEAQLRHCAFGRPDAPPLMFFRDDVLSDLIGFTYRDWHGDDAAGDLVHRLEQLQRTLPNPGSSVVSIIMDGENAWDHYPNNAWFFLKAFYERLTQNPVLEPTTFSECLATGVRIEPLPHVVSGSWIYGSFSTWIGSPDKNRAWDLLVAAKLAYDQAMAEGHLDAEARRRAEHQLAICEGSDWFWWFGDYNDPEVVRDFDALYRRQLEGLYRAIGRSPPPELEQPISVGGQQGGGGVMLRAGGHG